MVKVYFEVLESLPCIPVVAYYVDNERFFKNVPYIRRAYAGITERFVDRVDTPEEADFILVPHAYEFVMAQHDYIERVRTLAATHKKRILVFYSSDFDIHVDWPEAVVFRCTAYASELRPNEIVMPPIVEDLLGGEELTVRSLPERPVVGFVGWAGFGSLMGSLKAHIKDVLFCVDALVRGTYAGYKRKGIFLRMEMLAVLQKEGSVDTNFIIRDRYSGSVKANPTLDVERARKEYIDNIVGSDLTLAVRGDGNFSQRFFECLSLGRLPLLVDTDTALPLPDRISYERFVVRVPYDQRHQVAMYVRAFFDNLDQRGYELRQHEARAAFVEYLSISGFLRYMFVEENIFEHLPGF